MYLQRAKFCLANFLIIVGSIASAQLLRAQGFLRTETEAADGIASQLKTQLLEQKVDTVFVRNVRGKGATEVMLTTLLKEALKPDFRFGPGGVEIAGRVEALTARVDTNEVVAGYRFRAEVKDLIGGKLFLPVFVEVRDDIIGHAKGASHGIDRDQPPRVAGEPFGRIAAKPDFNRLISVNKILPHQDSLYAVEILVMRDGKLQPRQPSLENGALTVVLNRGEQYVVRAYNYSGYEAFASLSIDGVNRYALSRNAKNRENVDVIAPGGYRDLRGYCLSENEAASFLVGSYEESVAKRLLGEAPDIGLITVIMGASYPEGSKIPDAETEDISIAKSIQKTRTETMQSERTVRNSDGNLETRTETYTVNVPYTEQIELIESSSPQISSGSLSNVVGTTEGPVIPDRISVQQRTLGKVRATIKVRYHAG